MNSNYDNQIKGRKVDVWLRIDQINKVNIYAKKNGYNKSEMIRQMIDLYTE